MKLLVIGLDCASPDILFGDERLANVRHLMEIGCFGRLESTVPPGAVPGWICMATSQDPRSLRVFGVHRHSDHSDDGLPIADSRPVAEPAIWDQVARQGKRSVVLGLPSKYPLGTNESVSMASFGTADASGANHNEIAREISRVIGNDSLDVADDPDIAPDELTDAIRKATEKRFAIVRHLLQSQPWDYFQFVETGLYGIQHGLRRDHGPAQVANEPGHPHARTIRDFYRAVDQEIGSVLALLDSESAVLVISPDGARSMDGGAEPHGGFILAGPGVPPLGQIDGVHLLDIAPTLLGLGGYDVPPSMQGRSLAAGWHPGTVESGRSASPDDEEIVRERLRGLGYIN